MARRNTRNKTKCTASFDGVGKGFAPQQEYLVKVKECSVEDGESGPYYSMIIEGTGEFEGSIMYHNASLSPGALWRTREIFEAFLGGVPEGDFDVDEYAAKFIGKTAMCSTFKDTYKGQSRIKPEDFWPSEDEGEAGGADEVDLDDIDDADIKKLGKVMGIKSKRASTIREELAEADEDELLEAMQRLGLVEEEGEEEGEEEEGEGGIDLDELDEDDIKKLAEAAGIKVTAKSRASTLKKKLAELDEDELAEAAEEAGIGESSGGELTADDVSAMNQDELEELIEEHELEVDLDEHKTLRKKRAAVVDAAEEAGILAED
jgi:Holliday junction resolvasome RuvABC DNA-binding subunit